MTPEKITKPLSGSFDNAPQKDNPMQNVEPVTEFELVAAAHAAGGERVTDNQVEAFITTEHYFTGADGVAGSPEGRINGGQLGMLTFCILVLANGFTVYGVSACPDEKNFNPDIGKRLARANAKNKIWELLGFELRSKLAIANIVGSSS